PGILTTLIEFLRDNPDPTEQEVRIAISGNLCRCTGYQNIVTATLDAAKRLRVQPAQSALFSPSWLTRFGHATHFAMDRPAHDDGKMSNRSWPSASTISAT